MEVLYMNEMIKEQKIFLYPMHNIDKKDLDKESSKIYFRKNISFQLLVEIIQTKHILI
jgi:hypothetical protein